MFFYLQTFPTMSWVCTFLVLVWKERRDRIFNIPARIFNMPWSCCWRPKANQQKWGPKLSPPEARTDVILGENESGLNPEDLQCIMVISRFAHVWLAKGCMSFRKYRGKSGVAPWIYPLPGNEMAGIKRMTLLEGPWTSDLHAASFGSVSS